MWIQLIEAGILISDFVYHRWIEDHPHGARAEQDVQLPQSGEGATIPLLFGKCRVRAPVLAWTSAPVIDTSGFLGPPMLYTMSILFIAGIPMNDGNGVCALADAFIGETRVHSVATTFSIPTDGGAGLVNGAIDFKDGNPTQHFYPVSGGAEAADYMLNEPSPNGIAGTLIPAWRGYATVFFGGIGGYGGPSSPNHFVIGASPSVPAISFEISSYPTLTDAAAYPSAIAFRKIGDDANPIDVLYDIVVAKIGKLGLDASYINRDQWALVAYTLWVEGHGYSRAFEQFTSASEMIQSILAQIDATMYEDPSTGMLNIKLIRNDYDPTTIPVIDKTNCKELQDLAIGGLTGLPNKIRISFTNRASDYREGSALASNQANAVGQDGIVREQVVAMPGVTTQALADQMAERELAARSRPLIKCSAIVDRSFFRVVPGDVVKINWTAPDISGLVFRVAAVDRGTLADGRIKLDLIQDVFYVWRNQPPVMVELGGHDAGGGLGFGV